MDPATFHRVVTARGCQVHDDPLDCEPPVQAAHIIAKQTLKRHGHRDRIWDTRNGIGACYRAHRRSDAGLARFPVDRFPIGFWDFADEVNLRWNAERIYGKEFV